MSAVICVAAAVIVRSDDDDDDDDDIARTPGSRAGGEEESEGRRVCSRTTLWPYCPTRRKRYDFNNHQCVSREGSRTQIYRSLLAWLCPPTYFIMT